MSVGLIILGLDGRKDWIEKSAFVKCEEMRLLFILLFFFFKSLIHYDNFNCVLIANEVLLFFRFSYWFNLKEKK